MGIVDALAKISTDGVRIEIAFDQKSIQTLLLYGLVFAVAGGIISALIRKAMGA